MLGTIIQSGKSLGMQSMDDVLFKLAEDDVISPHDALMKATEKQRFETLV